VAAQTLYRWTDADGKVHYTDSPPPSSAKEARTVTTDAAADQRAADALREQNAAIAKRAAERNKTPDEREREKKDAERKTRCGALMNIVNAFDRGDPIFRESEKGKQELKGADREIERLRNTQQFQLECQDLANNASAAAAARVAGSPAGAANRPGAAATGGVGAGSNAAGGASTAGGRSASPSGKPGSTATPSGR
jgi:hypothetical protein